MGHVTLAHKTMARIEEMMEADQGATYRQILEKVIPHIGDAYRGVDSPWRSHLGASQMGTECGRALWYNFRWATKPKFSGRLLRLFNRGHLEEARFISVLTMIGVQVIQQDDKGKQYKISFAHGHGGGSGDGFAQGIPDLPPGTWALLEFKTHSDKYFKELKLKGVREAKLDHYVQMQTYMRKFGLTVALYGAVNKNDDELYFEIVHLDTVFVDQFIGRAEKIIWMHDAPAKINESPGWFGCKWCDHKPVCKLGHAPAKNCRTCAYSEPTEAGNGTWRCRLGDKDIPKDAQDKEWPCYKMKKM